MSELFKGRKIYLTLNVIMLIVTVVPMLSSITAWPGFLLSVLYLTFAEQFLWIAAIITNIAAFFLASKNKDSAVVAALIFGFIGGFLGSFLSECDERLAMQLRCVFIILLWAAVISPAANILLHQLGILHMLM